MEIVKLQLFYPIFVCSFQLLSQSSRSSPKKVRRETVRAENLTQNAIFNQAVFRKACISIRANLCSLSNATFLEIILA